MNHAEARNKIRTTQLINRLQKHAFGKSELTSTQIQATRILLDKVLPDAKSEIDDVKQYVVNILQFSESDVRMINQRTDDDELMTIEHTHDADTQDVVLLPVTTDES